MKIKSLVAALAIFAAAPVAAATVTHEVQSATASITGTGYSTGLTLAAGDSFSVTVVDPTDTWSLGAAPREFTADGLEQTVGGAYGGFTYLGFTFNYGTLVGRIGSGDFFGIGLGNMFVAANAGVLSLFNWDSPYGDNSGSITVAVSTPSAVPVPAAGLLLLSALGFAGAAARTRRKVA